MEKLKQKLSSRKLWAAIVGVAVGLAAAFGIGENDWAQVAGVVTSAVSVFAYIFGEAKVDAARQRYNVNIGEVLTGVKKMEKQEAAESKKNPTDEKATEVKEEPTDEKAAEAEEAPTAES